VYRECELKRFQLLILAAPSGGVLSSHEQGSDGRVMPIEPLRLGRMKFHHIRPETCRRDVITKSCVNLKLSSNANSHSSGQEIHVLRNSFHYRIPKSPLLVPTASQINSTYPLTSSPIFTLILFSNLFLGLHIVSLLWVKKW
jgi:hypothetical protein